jgi:hypothetical protein
MMENNDLTPEITIGDIIYRLEEISENVHQATDFWVKREIDIVINMCRKL